MPQETIVGRGSHRYEVIYDWAKLPTDWVLGQTSIVTDSENYVYLYNRSEHPFIILDPEGNVCDYWSESVVEAVISKVDHPNVWKGDVLDSAHGLFMDSTGDLLFAVLMCHVVLKCNRQGELLMTLGSWDGASNPDWDGNRLQWLNSPPPTSYGPFCMPTDVGVRSNGDIYVTDGYGNASVHRFSSDGELISTFGMPGQRRSSEDSSLHLPHGIWVHTDGRLFVTDRQNNRVQILSADGEYLEEWTGFTLPCDIVVDSDNLVYVSEGGTRMCSILTIDGEPISDLAADSPAAQLPPGRSASGGGHAVWVDTEGSIYVNQNVEGQRLLKYVRV